MKFATSGLNPLCNSPHCMHPVPALNSPAIPVMNPLPNSPHCMHPVPALNSPAIPVVKPLKQLTTLHAPSSSSQLTCNTCRETTKATHHTACTQFQLSTHLQYLSCNHYPTHYVTRCTTTPSSPLHHATPNSSHTT